MPDDATSATGFRDYLADEARPSVAAFYRENHVRQTHSFAAAQKRRFSSLQRRQMKVWDAMETLDTFVDDSDPDTELSQLEHLLQSAEAARRAGEPDWMVVTALVHDLGKVLTLFGEPQWAVVGDTFPLGCRFQEALVYHSYFEQNPDTQNSEYCTDLGIYPGGVGLDAVQMSWGHDEYLFHVMRRYLPDEALYVIRYHSFYGHHVDRAYDHLLSERDYAMLPWLTRFNAYDLYSKAEEPPDVEKLRPYYETLLAKFFTGTLAW